MKVVEEKIKKEEGERKVQDKVKAAEKKIEKEEQRREADKQKEANAAKKV